MRISPKGDSRVENLNRSGGSAKRRKRSWLGVAALCRAAAALVPLLLAAFSCPASAAVPTIDLTKSTIVVRPGKLASAEEMAAHVLAEERSEEHTSELQSR